MLVVGLDENGLGPRLGPMTCTAVALRARRTYRPKRAIAIAREAGIDDSKATSAHGRMAAAEGVALALLEAIGLAVPVDADGLLAALHLDGLLALRARCPRSASPQCWGVRLALPAFGDERHRDAGREAVASLAKAGLVPLGVRTVYLCAAAVNDARAGGGNKFLLDLASFERLVEDAHRRHAAVREAGAHFVCGMVGGLRRYAPHMALATRFAITSSSEKRGCSSYELDGLGRVSFEVDADAKHAPVALASMVGKYVRELAMERARAFYRGHLGDDLPFASGYHDPITRRFVQMTGPVRKRFDIADTCFER